jgi:hypothetical protein
LLFASVALAQPPGGPGFGGPGGFGPGPGGPGFGGPGGFGPGFGGPGGPFGNPNVSHLLTLAEDGAVWDEIKITDEQLGKVKRLRPASNKQFRQLREEIRTQQAAAGGPGSGQPVDPATMFAARQAERQAMQENVGVMKEHTEAALQKILKPAQYSRLRQIDLQEQGPLVVVRPDVARALNLSPAQIDQAQTIIDQATNQSREQMMQSGRDFFQSFQNNNNNNNGDNNRQPPANPDPEAMRARFQTYMENLRTTSQGLKDQAAQQVLRILTKAQRTKFDGLLGAPFDLALLNDGRGPTNPLVGGPPPMGPMGPGGGPGTAAPANSPATKAAAPSSAKGKTSAKAAAKR